MERILRKQQNLLVDAGMGVIMFGIWGVAKVNMYLAMSSEFAEAWRVTAMESQPGEEFIMIGIGILIAVLLVSDLAMRLYIGLSAVADGKGKKKGYAYLLLTAVFLGASLQSSWHMYHAGVQQIGVTQIMGFLLEMASLYVLLEVLIAGFRVKRLRRKMKR